LLTALGVSECLHTEKQFDIRKVLGDMHIYEEHITTTRRRRSRFVSGPPGLFAGRGRSCPRRGEDFAGGTRPVGIAAQNSGAPPHSWLIDVRPVGPAQPPVAAD